MYSKKFVNNVLQHSKFINRYSKYNNDHFAFITEHSKYNLDYCSQKLKHYR